VNPNPAQVIVLLVCLGFVLLVVLAFEVLIFRAACSLCKIPQPGFLRTIGLVVLLLAVPAGVDAFFSGVLYEVYQTAKYPLWEAGVVQFFLALPVHMTICSAIHAKVVRIPMSQGLSVWLVEKLLKLAIITLIVGFIALLFAIGKGQ